MSKVVKRLVCRQPVSYFEQHALLSCLQSVYRKHHATETAVLKVISDVLLAVDRRDVMPLGLLSSRQRLIRLTMRFSLIRLQTSFRICGKALSWILSFILQQTQTVSFNEKQLTKSAVVCGVPQGSVLGPVLFLLHTADMIGIAHHHGITPHLL